MENNNQVNTGEQPQNPEVTVHNAILPNNQGTLNKTVCTAIELLGLNITKVPTLWDPFFPKVGVVALAGSSDTGKSAFLRQFAIAVASGDAEFMGFSLNPEHFQVLYVSTEDDQYATAALLHKQTTNNSESE